MVEVKYNDTVIASLEAGQTATLQCNGKKMVGDVKVTAPEVVDNPLPIEVETEIQINTLLLLEETEVGAVYKYTGATTSKYENGALYVVEEHIATDATVTIYNTSTVFGAIVYQYGNNGEIGRIEKNSSLTITVPIGSIVYAYGDDGLMPSWTNTSTTGDISYGYELGYMCGEYTINGSGTITGYAFDTD
ncbi:MAG: hypothetical protein J6V49_07520 [Bacteroidales bacterium]|nr:hypothetical protein [Bacteroidales bacterium]